MRKKTSTQNTRDLAQLEVNLLTASLVELNTEVANLETAKAAETNADTQAALQGQVDARKQEIASKQPELKNAKDDLTAKKRNYEQKNMNHSNAAKRESATFALLQSSEAYKSAEKARQGLATLKSSSEANDKCIADTGTKIADGEKVVKVLEGDLETLAKQPGAFAETTVQAKSDALSGRTNIHDTDSMRVAAEKVAEIVKMVVDNDRVVDICLENRAHMDSDTKEFCNNVILGSRYEKLSFEQQNIEQCMSVLATPSGKNAALVRSCERIVRLYVDDLEKRKRKKNEK